MAHTACLVLGVSNVSGHCKNPLCEEQALAAGTKQSQQADKAIGPVCLVLCLLLVLFLPSGIFTNIP